MLSSKAFPPSHSLGIILEKSSYNKEALKGQPLFRLKIRLYGRFSKICTCPGHFCFISVSCGQQPQIGPSSLDTAWILLIFKAISLSHMQIHADGAQVERCRNCPLREISYFIEGYGGPFFCHQSLTCGVTQVRE